MYSAVSVRGVWVSVEGGVAAKCWRPPIFPARWLKKWLLLTELTRKFVFLLRAGNEKNQQQVQYREKQLLFYLNSPIYAPKWLENECINWYQTITTSEAVILQAPALPRDPPATTNRINNSVGRGENWDPPLPERVASALFACPDRTSHGDSILNMNQIKSETGFKIRCTLKMLILSGFGAVWSSKVTAYTHFVLAVFLCPAVELQPL